jgi:hypothetical protein
MIISTDEAFAALKLAITQKKTRQGEAIFAAGALTAAQLADTLAKESNVTADTEVVSARQVLAEAIDAELDAIVNPPIPN